MRYVLLLFIGMPILEIGLLFKVGGWLGPWTTLLIVILTAVLGTWMLRHQSAVTLKQAQSLLQDGKLPAQQICEAILLLIGGALLLTPGFVTDAFGFLCLLPWSRQRLAEQITARTRRGAVLMSGGTARGSAGGPFGGASGRGFPPGVGAGNAGNSGDFGISGSPFDASGSAPRKRPPKDDAIEGEFRELD